MSTIRVDNFGPSAGGTTYSARGIAKAWVNFNGTGTIAARDSQNVSSLTDNGTGSYAINLTNAMSDDGYAATGFFRKVVDANILAAVSTPTASILRLEYANTSGTGQADLIYVWNTFHGDLA
jgi:hypothetical protein